MPILHQILEIETQSSLEILNLTPLIEKILTHTAITQGYAIAFTRHTTTALAINEYEERLLEDIKTHLRTLAPPEANYLHNDLHLRDVPPDEPINAHSHIMAMMLNNTEIIPIIEGKLGLGIYQSLLFFELDGPRQRQVLLQINGE